MDLGFETIGNATLIAYDGGPLLCTDPWIVGTAYFGSWVHQHEIPAEQMEAILQAPYVWISHGHPDHLSLESLELLRKAEILVPDHHGNRVARELREAGYRVRVLKCREWTELSPRVRVCCVADVHQDAVLLLDMDGTLVVNANDASDRGGGDFLRAQAERFERSYLMALVGYGDADMIHMFDEAGDPVPPPGAPHEELGPGIIGILEHFGIDAFVPFSTLHRYQRSDSEWANAYITQPHDFGRGFDSSTKSLLPAYARVDLLREDVRCLEPRKNDPVIQPPEAFGDNWSDQLTAEDVTHIAEYFGRFDHLRTFLGFVNFRVGGRDNEIAIPGTRPKFKGRGVTFETPRASLMTCVEYRIFDDLMIGNFTRTTLHGDWGGKGTEATYPDFNPFVTKFGDNGGACSEAELRAYFADYAARGFFSFGEDPAQRAEYAALRRYL